MASTHTHKNCNFAGVTKLIKWTHVNVANWSQLRHKNVHNVLITLLLASIKSKGYSNGFNIVDNENESAPLCDSFAL